MEIDKDLLLSHCSRAMLERLNEYEYEYGGPSTPLFELMYWLDDKAGELNNAIVDLASPAAASEKAQNVTYEFIRMKAAHVANYAALIIYQCDMKITEEE